MGVELGLGGLITIFGHEERKHGLGRVWSESITSVIDLILSLVMHTTLLLLSEKVPWSIPSSFNEIISSSFMSLDRSGTTVTSIPNVCIIVSLQQARPEAGTKSIQKQ